jgi:DNA repair protein RadC
LTTKWKHPGGKLREKGAASLSEQELLSIIISPGIKGRPAELIAKEVLQKFGSLEGLANQPLERLLVIKGLSDVKITRIAAALS